MNKLFLFLLCSISFLSAINKNEKKDPSDPKSIDPKNPQHRLMQHLTEEEKKEGMPDYFREIRLIITNMLMQTDRSAMIALACTCKAYAQIVNTITGSFSQEEKRIIAKFRPYTQDKTLSEMTVETITRRLPTSYYNRICKLCTAIFKEENLDKIDKIDIDECIFYPSLGYVLYFLIQEDIDNERIITTVFERLINAGLDVDEINEWELLHEAIENKRITIVKKLLDAGADKNAKNRYEWTPLHIAVFKNYNEEIVKLLLSTNNLDQQTGEGCFSDRSSYPYPYNTHAKCTALHIASHKGLYSLAQLLLQAGADPNVRGRKNWNALMFAIESGHIKTACLLLEHGAQVNLVGFSRVTPLHLAAHNGNSQLVKLLIKHGALVNANDIDGCTPLDRAANDEIKGVLLYNGGVNGTWKNSFVQKIGTAIEDKVTDFFSQRFFIKQKRK